MEIIVGMFGLVFVGLMIYLFIGVEVVVESFMKKVKVDIED